MPCSKERQVHLLDAPLDGGGKAPWRVSSPYSLAGKKRYCKRVRPVLDAFARSVVWVGDLGAGSVTKIVHNALAMSIDLVLTECLTLGPGPAWPCRDSSTPLPRGALSATT